MTSPENVEKHKQIMLNALEATLGIVSQAANNCGQDRNNHYRWLKEDANYKKRVEEIDEMVIDLSESMLHKNVKEGKEASIFFHLKCKAKHRGYREKDIEEAPKTESHHVIDLADRILDIVKTVQSKE